MSLIGPSSTLFIIILGNADLELVRGPKGPTDYGVDPETMEKLRAQMEAIAAKFKNLESIVSQKK